MSGTVVRVGRLVAEAGGRRLVADVSFEVAAGQIVAIVGASGSGKTTLGRALLGEAGPGVRLTGRVEVGGRIVTPAAPPPPGVVAYIPQQPAAALNPVRRIGSVLYEIARCHTRTAGGRRARRAAVHEAVRAALGRVALPTDRSLLRRFPHQLSGGQQQRLVIAQALLTRARLLVADEPTTGQDSLHRRDLGHELRSLARSGMAVVLLSHDLHLVRSLAGRTVVLAGGVVAGSGPTADMLGPAGRDDVDRRHPDAATPVVRDDTPVRPSVVEAGAEAGDDVREPPVLLSVAGVVAEHRDGGRRRTVLHGITVEVAAGRCLAVVGRSGGGKTTLARCVVGLHRPSAGTIRLAGRPLAATLDRRTPADLAAVQYVFQDARASFHPFRSVLDQVARPALRLRGMTSADARDAALAGLAATGLTGETVGRRPDRLSGGELQRAALARALLAGPRLLVCDEITSGLDTTTRDQILTMVGELRRSHGLTLLVISHDPAVVARLADDVVVLDDGRLVESGPTPTLLTAARHPLTRSLLLPAGPVPHNDPRTEERRTEERPTG